MNGSVKEEGRLEELVPKVDHVFAKWNSLKAFWHGIGAIGGFKVPTDKGKVTPKVEIKDAGNIREDVVGRVHTVVGAVPLHKFFEDLVCNLTFYKHAAVFLHAKKEGGGQDGETQIHNIHKTGELVRWGDVLRVKVIWFSAMSCFGNGENIMW